MRLIYAALGRPDLPTTRLDRAAEIASRSETITATKKSGTKFTRSSGNSATPDDIESWWKAEAAAVNDSATEIRALRMARQLTNDDPAFSLLAEALSRAADGCDRARPRFDCTVLATDPDEPRALFLSGLAAFQDGDYQAAVTRWQNCYQFPLQMHHGAHCCKYHAAEAGGIYSPRHGPEDSIAAAADMSKDRKR